MSAPTFSINRSDVIRNQVQQAIRPETVALSAFGAIAAFAMLVLVAQGLAQMVGRSAPDIAVFRALGATRGQAALAVLAARSVRPREIGAGVGSSAVARAAAAAGLPAAAVVGTRNAFEPGTGVRAVPVRSGSCRSSRSRWPRSFSAWSRWCWPATCWRRCPRPWPRGRGRGSA